MYTFIRRFELARPFTEAEAWLLFRIAAVAEACGWTLLIIGILINPYVSPHSNTALILAGRTHGMLFMIYCFAALGLYPCLGWSRWRALFALGFSVPPYGTLVFERWASSKRHNAGFRTYRQFLLYTAIAANAVS
jgi:integral membrane protein